MAVAPFRATAYFLCYNLRNREILLKEVGV